MRSLILGLLLAAGCVNVTVKEARDTRAAGSHFDIRDYGARISDVLHR